MDYKIIGYIAAVLVVFLIFRRILITWVFNKLVRAEYEHVLNHDQYKVKGRYQ